MVATVSILSEKSNLILIGMPGSGKSTLGRRLADDLGLVFVDTDRLIEQRESLLVQEIVDMHGVNYFRSVEQAILCDLKVERRIISTGGSAVLSKPAMQYLSSIGKVLYLKIQLSTMLQRIDDSQTRGLVKQSSDSLSDLYYNRLDSYQTWANLTVENDRPLSDLRYSEIRQAIMSN